MSSAPMTLIFLREGLQGNLKLLCQPPGGDTSAGSLGDALPAPGSQDATRPRAPAPSPGMALPCVDNGVQTPSVTASSQQPGQTPQHHPRSQRCPSPGPLSSACPGAPSPTWDLDQEAVLHMPQEVQMLSQGWERMTALTLSSSFSQEQRLICGAPGLVSSGRPNTQPPHPPPQPPGPSAGHKHGATFLSHLPTPVSSTSSHAAGTDGQTDGPEKRQDSMSQESAQIGDRPTKVHNAPCHKDGSDFSSEPPVPEADTGAPPVATLCFVVLRGHSVPYTRWVCRSASSKPTSAVFPTAFARFVSLCHTVVNSRHISKRSLRFCLSDLWSLIRITESSDDAHSAFLSNQVIFH